MRLRLTFGPILILLLLGLMWLDGFLDRTQAGINWPVLVDADGTFRPGLPLILVGLVICGRAGYELRQMFAAKGLQASAKSLTFCSAAGLLAGVLTIGPQNQVPISHDYTAAVLATAAAAAVFLTMLAFLRHKDPKGAGGAVASAITAFTYVGLTLAFMMAIRREYAVWVMVLVVLTIKACDSGAYFTGKAVGRHKLIPWLSPGKTWEGLAGGLVCAAACGFLFKSLGGKWGPDIIRHVPTWHWIVFGLLLGGFGQLGDLSASVFKRDAGIKDSGTILPGFGGMIDMLDSLLLTGPIAYWMLHLIARP